MRKITSLLSMLFLLWGQSVFAQQTISGNVKDNSTSQPLPKVTVSVEGTSVATTTDNNGDFSIQVPAGKKFLMFTNVGYEAQTVAIGARTEFNILLKQSIESLDQVIIVGYGTQKRGDVTGAISTVDVKKTLTGRPIADVGRGLQGAVSGLNVTIPSGEVGSDPILKIRGAMTSFQGSSSPLILLDNVEIPSIQIVNPNEIASISVLKDAASASIYGAKASNGVILITTKKGSGTSTPQITYSGNLSWQNVWKDLNMGGVNALKYTVDAGERIGNFGINGAFYYVDRASYLKAVEWQNLYGGSIGPNDPTVYGRDWYVQGAANNQKMGVRTYNPYDYMIKEWAPTQQHDITVGQTLGKTSFNLGLGYLEQSGMIKPAKKDNFSRYNASLRVSTDINKYITIRGGAMYSRRNKQYPYATVSTTADPWLYLYRWGPGYPFGDDQNGDPIRSPVEEYGAANTANILQNYMNVNLGTTLKFTDDWKFDFDYTYSTQDEAWKRPGTRFTAADSWSAPVKRMDDAGNPIYVDSTGKEVSSSAPGAMQAYDLNYHTYTSVGGNPDHIIRSTTNFASSTINAFTTYNWKLTQDHQFKFILGINRVAANSEYQYQRINQLTDIHNPQFNFAIGTPPIVLGDKSWESQLGYFGRINYAFKDKYLIEGNLRRDGSSKFPTELQWRWFPSVSAGWIVTGEKFMQSQNIINFFKIRGSWGSIGDQTVPNNLYIPIMPAGLSNWIVGSSRAFYVGTPAAVKHDIQWQDIETKNLGLDMGFFENKMTVTFDLYQRNTNNMIVPAEGVPLTFGTGAPQGNFGALRTNGWELTVEFNHRFKNGVGVNFMGNISDSKTFIEEYGPSKLVNSNYNGKNIGEIWGYRTDRLYQMEDFELGGDGKPQLVTLTADDVPAKYVGKKAYKLKPGKDGEKPVYQVFLQNSSNFFFGPGDVKFQDLNGDGIVDNGGASLDDHGDLDVIGNSNPRYNYGFRLGADFKGFDISVFFQGVGSRQVWGNGFMAIPGYQSSDGAAPAAFVDDYWTPDNTTAFYPAAYNNAASNTTNNMHVQDRYLLNMAYLRLKNLTLGYTLPQNLVKKVGINSLRVYGALENFFTWDHLKGLPIDPEYIDGYSMWNISNYNLGRTGMGVPAFKSVSVGLQLNF